MFKSLLRTLPSLSGNFTIACKLNEIKKDDSENYHTYVRVADLLPLQNNIYKDSIELKIGLPTIADSYAYKLDNTFLLTTSENNDLNIFISLDNHPYETLITEKSNIRPIIYMKDNISIVDGDGTYSSPYKLGGLINEEE